MSSPVGRSLHIGVNEVDPAHYVGQFGRLKGAVNDALFMERLAEFYMFTQRCVLIDCEATSERVTREIRSAAAELDPGSFFLLTFAGHGAQLLNKPPNDPRPEANDQTWCLWDRQMVDDELRALWSEFDPNVRVLVVVDACHSGTSVSYLRAQFRRLFGLVPYYPTTADRALAPIVNALTHLFHWKQYRHLASYVGPAVPANVLSIAACLDSERTPDGYPNGRFTEAIMKVWDEGRFSGSHQTFFELLSKEANTYGKHPKKCCDTDPVFRDAPAFKI